MKMRDYLFLCNFIKDHECLDLIKSYIKDGKCRGKLPRKFNKNLPDIPYRLITPKGCEYSVWVLIAYDGCNKTTVLNEGSLGLICPETTQRAICVKLSDKGVCWDLYQTSANTLKFSDIKDGIRTYSKVKGVNHV